MRSRAATPKNLDWWKSRIATDRSVIKYWDFPAPNIRS